MPVYGLRGVGQRQLRRRATKSRRHRQRVRPGELAGGAADRPAARGRQGGGREVSGVARGRRVEGVQRTARRRGHLGADPSAGGVVGRGNRDGSAVGTIRRGKRAYGQADQAQPVAPVGTVRGAEACVVHLDAYLTGLGNAVGASARIACVGAEALRLVARGGSATVAVAAAGHAGLGWGPTPRAGGRSCLAPVTVTTGTDGVLRNARG